MAWLDEDQRIFFEEHIRKVEEDLCALVQSETSRFPSRNKLLQRLRESEKRLMSEGTDALSQFFESHNELCIAAEILKDPTDGGCSRLEYEPPLDGCNRFFDFSVVYRSGPTRWIEVKTIHPKMKDDWNRYLKDFQNDRFTQRTRLVLERDWMGGELYHQTFAARSKIMEYTLETEEKIEDCLKSQKERITFLAFFSNGFDWHIDHLEDFVFFYRHGTHFDGDHFSKMEQHYLETKGITLKRNIQHFSYIKRPDVSVRPVGGTWSVEPTRWPPE